MNTPEQRKADFSRNASLEDWLQLVNEVLQPAEQQALATHIGNRPAHPVIFIMGPLRSGTTLFTQWLSGTGLAACPTNLLSRFYSAPVTGALIQRLLTDPAFAFRDELADLSTEPGYDSANGKTSGSLSPNEFWYFWRHFLPFDDHDRLDIEAMHASAAGAQFARELRGLTRVFEKPFALKGMIANYCIPQLAELLPEAIFVALRRDPASNVVSALRARERQFGSREQWYSFRIPEYEQLRDQDPITQTAGQVHFINQAVAAGLAEIPAERKLLVEYEAFCRSPAATFGALCELLKVDSVYAGPESFAVVGHDESADYAAARTALTAFS